jgi:hypothetical protein
LGHTEGPYFKENDNLAQHSQIAFDEYGEQVILTARVGFGELSLGRERLIKIGARIMRASASCCRPVARTVRCLALSG